MNAHHSYHHSYTMRQGANPKHSAVSSLLRHQLYSLWYCFLAVRCMVSSIVPCSVLLVCVALLAMASSMALPILSAKGWMQSHNSRPVLDSLLKELRLATNDSMRVVLLCAISTEYTASESDYVNGEIVARQALKLAERVQSKLLMIYAFKALGYAHAFPEHPRIWDAVAYYRRALELAEEIGNKRQAAYTLRWWLYFVRDRMLELPPSDARLAAFAAEAFALLEKCERYAKQLNDHTLQGSCFSSRAILCAAQHKYVQAFDAIEQARRHYQAHDDAKRAAYCLEYEAQIATRIGDSPRALTAYLRAIQVADSLQAFGDKAVYMTHLAEFYSQQGNLAKAMGYYQQALPLMAQHGSKVHYALLVEDIGQLYQTQGALDSAEYWYRQARDVRTAMRDNSGIYHLKLGSLLMAQRRYQQALDTLNHGFALHQRLKHRQEANKYTLEFLLTIADVQQCLGRTKVAEQFAKQALDRAQEQQFPEYIAQACRRLYELARQQQPARALEYYERYVRVNDTLFSRDKARNLAAIEARSALEYRQERIQRLEQEARLNALRQQWLIVAVVAAVIVIGVVLLLYRAKLRSERELRQKHEEIISQQTILEEQSQRLQQANAALNQRNEELHAANQELQRVNEQLDEANTFKLRMLSMASHDLKNPLSSIIALAEMLPRIAHQADKVKEVAQRMGTTGWKMLHLISDLMDVAAQSVGAIRLNLQRMNLRYIAQTVVSRHEPEMQRKNQTLLSAIPDECYVYVDPERFDQILDNVISNAIKYSPHGKTIWLDVVLDEQQQQLLLHREQLPPAEKPSVMLTVRDEGPGISSDDKQKLFGLFQRLSARPTDGEHSTGVGLAVTKHLVELHGGRIWCDTTSFSVGAMFVIEIPLLRAGVTCLQAGCCQRQENSIAE